MHGSSTRRSVSTTASSVEFLRRTHVDEQGQERHVAEEFAVVDRVGRLQLPREYTTALDIRDRVRLALETDHIGVWPGADRPQEEGGDDA